MAVRRVDPNQRDGAETATTNTKAWNVGYKLGSSKKTVVIAVIVAITVIVGLAIGCNGFHEGQVKPPISSSSVSGKNYQDVVTQFEKAGFTDITIEPLGDLILGLLNGGGDVAEVSIEGDARYSEGSWYSPDAKVVIRYHSFPEKKEDDSQSGEAQSESSQASDKSAASSADAKEPAASDSGSSEPSKEAADGKDELAARVQGYVGQPLLSVCEELKADGINFKLVHEVTGADMTSAYQFGDFDDGDMVVTKASAQSAQNVTLTIVSAELSAQAKERENAKAALESRLSASSAWIAASNYGKAQYPYGFKLHYFIGVLAEEARDENTWFLKATCDVTNEYNAKAKGLTCEACVTGTDDNPEVTYFVVY